MRSLFLLSALLLSSFIMAQNTDKVNQTKHIQLSGLSDPKGYQLWENFEDMLMPPTGWQLQQGPTPATWDTASFDPCMEFGYVHCLYDQSLSGIQDERLISRVVDMRTFSSAFLSFYFQFSKYWGISPYDNYDLLVLASTDSAQTFPDTLWRETDSDTSTWNNFNWVHAVVDLSPYIGTEHFAVAFVYYGYDGAEAALDMVSIETVGGMEESTMNLFAYPNPASNNLRIDESDSGTLTICDLDGRMVMSRDFGGNETIDISMLTPGRYMVSLQTKNSVKNMPLIITR
ncbi:hypothetical protein SDC9_52458 [bioreactor metagenome]|uniref:Secretion system C-terminal sorting domain-containing protein n=1 Tax=bioreactor metagenome TaxID=1076179 RepID=A0A644WQZ7_9ZZZZ